MVGDFKGPDGVDYSPIDLYAKYSVTPEQVTNNCIKVGVFGFYKFY